MEDTQITASIIVHEAAFAKEESYFLILQLGETEKIRSDVSEKSRTPTFTPHVLILSSKKHDKDYPTLQLSAFVIPSNSNDPEGAVKLGSAVISVTDYLNKGNQDMQISFTRTLDSQSKQSLKLGSASITLSLTEESVPEEITAFTPPNRPFTASASTGTFEICVRYGRNVAKDAAAAVVARIGPFASKACIECRVAQEPMTESNHFASTKAVENDYSWNEILVLQAPGSSCQDALRLDVVTNKTSFVSWSIPLTRFKTDESISFLLSSDETDCSLAISVFRRDAVTTEIQSFEATEPQIQSVKRIETLIQNLELEQELDGLTFVAELVKEDELLHKIEHVSQESFPFHTSAEESSPETSTAVPHKLLQTIPEATKDFNIARWDYPVLFTLDSTQEVMDTDLFIMFKLYTRSKEDETYQIYGYGSSKLESEQLMDGSWQDIQPIPILRTVPIPDRENLRLGFLTTRQRLWNTPSLCRFLKNAEKQTVTRTNRAALPDVLDWMGAISRGLNRSPISSVSDRGGLSGVVYRSFSKDMPPVELPAELPPAVEENNAMDFIREAEASFKDRIVEYEAEQATLRQQLKTLNDEVVHKQSLVDRLLNEVDRRTDAIKSCGAEIVDLRQQNKVLTQESVDLRTKLTAYVEKERRQEADIATALDRVNEGRNTGQLSKQFALLNEKYQSLQMVNKGLVHQVQSSGALNKQMSELKSDYSRLEKAHAVQGAYLQKLQQDHQKVSVYKSTVRTQERVISKLEQLIESKVVDIGSESSVGPSVQAELHKLRLENKQLKQRSGGGGGDQETINVRVRVLEEQLQRNAREAAKEISELKMKLFSVEMGL